jgi:DNA polymerase zeta
VRFGHYASVSSQPPGAVVASKAVLRDECAVPPYNWRVPYVVVHGIPNAPLKNLVYTPEEIMRRGSELRLNYVYYMVKCINPALDRVLSMCGGEVFQWFKCLSRPKLRLRHINYDAYAPADRGNSSSGTAAYPVGLGADVRGKASKHKQTSMDQFTKQGSCEICQQDAQPQRTLCASCAEDPQMALCVVMGRMKLVTEKERDLSKICQNCTRIAQSSVLFVKGEIVGPDCCESLNCPVFFERARLVTRLEDVQAAAREIEDSSH